MPEYVKFDFWIGPVVKPALPDFVVSSTEVAVTVTAPEFAAVNNPALDIDPALACQVTAELKPPVPCTSAEHWLVCPACKTVAKQEAVTEVIVGGGMVEPPPPELPPQAARAAQKSGASVDFKMRRLRVSPQCASGTRSRWSPVLPRKFRANRQPHGLRSTQISRHSRLC